MRISWLNVTILQEKADAGHWQYFSTIKCISDKCFRDHQHNNGESGKRKNFIKNIAFELLQPYLRSRLQCKTLTKKLRLQIETHLPDPGPSTTQDTNIQIKKRDASFVQGRKTERPKQYAANV
ncbi:hypothetical protein T03_7816 [Trichinella britovi]|uniref:Uncharacterized protein n=1 Tax=Trichinella britovi TaxID=45882 RepID=A0A0V1AJG2_TRIBR|nr:hypothetical protein T03_7816 [Trichinella britovi]